MHAKIKRTELWLIFSLMYVEKVHQFLSSIKKMHTKENLFPFSASQCTIERTASRQGRVANREGE